MTTLPPPSPTLESDDALCRRYAAGEDQRAFQVLVQRHARMVWQTARRRCGNDEAASEVTQDVFVVLARKAGGLRCNDGLGPWLHRVTVILSRKAASQWAQYSKYQATLLQTVNTNLSAPEPKPVSPLLGALDEALDRLSAEERQLLLWRFVDQLSLKEIARRWKKSEAACQKQSERALAKLRQFLERRGLAVAGLTAILSSLSTGSASAALAGAWAETALHSTGVPKSFTTAAVIAHAWRRWPMVKWALPLAAILAVVVVNWPSSVEESPPVDLISASPRHAIPVEKAIQVHPPSTIPTPSKPDPEPLSPDEMARLDEALRSGMKLLYQIHQCLFAFASSHDQTFPDGATANEAFRELFKADLVDDERLFFIKDLGGNFPGPDMKLGEETLKPGECNISYIRGLTTDLHDTKTPIIYYKARIVRGMHILIVVRIGGNATVYKSTDGIFKDDQRKEDVEILSPENGVDPQDILAPEAP